MNFNQDQSDKREALSVLKLYLIYQTQNPVIVIQIIKKNEYPGKKRSTQQATDLWIVGWFEKMDTMHWLMWNFDVVIDQKGCHLEHSV